MAANSPWFCSSRKMARFSLKRKAACALLFSVAFCEEEDKEAWPKRGKTRQWIKRRKEKGLFNVIDELRIEDTAAYREMMRMNYETFKQILDKIEPLITKRQVQGGHKVIKPAERLAITIRYLATGESFASLHFQFRCGESTISYIVREVCQAIFKVLGPEYLKVPSSNEEWENVSYLFEDRWQYPNCIGAIDGKHVRIKPPPGSGSHYFNYKKWHSVVLIAVAGPNYECLYADVGTNGRVSDGGVWSKCNLLQSLENGTMGVPQGRPLPFGKDPVPYVLLGDDAFALRPFLMKPFPQRNLTMEKRVYNYRFV